MQLLHKAEIFKKWNLGIINFMITFASEKIILQYEVLNEFFLNSGNSSLGIQIW